MGFGTCEEKKMTLSVGPFAEYICAESHAASLPVGCSVAKEAATLASQRPALTVRVRGLQQQTKMNH